MDDLSPEPLGSEAPQRKTGEYTRVTGEHLATNLEVKAVGLAVSIRNAVTALISLCVFVGGLFSAYWVLMGKVEAATDAGVHNIQVQVTEIQSRIARDEVEITSVKVEVKEVKADVREVQLDLRELYRTMQTGERSVRLENPPQVPRQDAGP